MPRQGIDRDQEVEVKLEAIRVSDTLKYNPDANQRTIYYLQLALSNPTNQALTIQPFADVEPREGYRFDGDSFEPKVRFSTNSDEAQMLADWGIDREQVVDLWEGKLGARSRTSRWFRWRQEDELLVDQSREYPDSVVRFQVGGKEYAFNLSERLRKEIVATVDESEADEQPPTIRLSAMLTPSTAYDLYKKLDVYSFDPVIVLLDDFTVGIDPELPAGRHVVYPVRLRQGVVVTSNALLAERCFIEARATAASIRTAKAMIDSWEASSADPLLQLWLDESLTIDERRSLVAELAPFGDQTQVRELMVAVMENGTVPLRRSLLEALRNKPRATGARDLIRRALADEEWEIRAVACELCGKYMVDEAVELLSTRLADSETGVRQSACDALGAIGSAKAIQKLAEHCQEEQDASVFRALIEQSASLKSAKLDEAIVQFVAEYPELRADVLRLVTPRPYHSPKTHRALTNLLVEALIEDEQLPARWAEFVHVSKLTEAQEKQLVARLSAQAKRFLAAEGENAADTDRGNPDNRRDVAMMLGQAQCQEAFEPLDVLLQSDSNSVEAAAIALGLIGDPRSAGALHRKLSTLGEGSEHRLPVLCGLMLLGDPVSHLEFEKVVNEEVVDQDFRISLFLESHSPELNQRLVDHVQTTEAIIWNKTQTITDPDLFDRIVQSEKLQGMSKWSIDQRLQMEVDLVSRVSLLESYQPANNIIIGGVSQGPNLYASVADVSMGTLEQDLLYCRDIQQAQETVTQFLAEIEAAATVEEGFSRDLAQQYVVSKLTQFLMESQRPDLIPAIVSVDRSQFWVERGNSKIVECLSRRLTWVFENSEDQLEDYETTVKALLYSELDAEHQCLASVLQFLIQDRRSKDILSDQRLETFQDVLERQDIETFHIGFAEERGGVVASISEWIADLYLHEPLTGNQLLAAIEERCLAAKLSDEEVSQKLAPFRGSLKLATVNDYDVWHPMPEPTPVSLPSGDRIKISQAGGVLTDQFMFVQSMPQAEFLQFAEQLRSRGYHAYRIRPYVKGDELLVAAIMRRSDRQWDFALGLSEDDVKEMDAKLQLSGLTPIDIAVHRLEDKLYFSATWTDPGEVPLKSRLGFHTQLDQHSEMYRHPRIEDERFEVTVCANDLPNGPRDGVQCWIERERLGPHILSVNGTSGMAPMVSMMAQRSGFDLSVGKYPGKKTLDYSARLVRDRRYQTVALIDRQPEDIQRKAYQLAAFGYLPTTVLVSFDPATEAWSSSIFWIRPIDREDHLPQSNRIVRSRHEKSSGD